MSDPLRFFARTAAIIFTTLIVLLGGALTASGAFRPVRFFVAGPNDFSMNPLYAVFETGELYRFALPGERIFDLQFSPTSIMWINRDREVVFWKNGQRQILGESFVGPDNYTRWSFADRTAWVQPRAQSPDIKDLGVSDGLENLTLTRNAAEISNPMWLLDGRLWWLERTTADPTHWRVMQWDGSEISTLFDDMPAVNHIGFLSCGAIWFEQNSSTSSLYLWNGIMAAIRVNGVARISNVGSWDCQTFILGNGSEQFIWNGTELYRFPFTYVSPLDNANTFLGVERLVEDGDWTMHRWRDGQVLQSIVLPHSHLFPQPQFTPYLLDPQTLLVKISNVGGIGDIYRWDLVTNQLHKITGEDRVRDINGPRGIQVFGSGTDQRLGWCGGLSGDGTNTIYQWEASTYTVTSIQTNAVCDLRAMSDGSLIGRVFPELHKSSVFFRWDGETVHFFPRNDDIGTSTFLYSDWMTLQ